LFRAHARIRAVPLAGGQAGCVGFGLVDHLGRVVFHRPGQPFGSGLGTRPGFPAAVPAAGQGDHIVGVAWCRRQAHRVTRTVPNSVASSLAMTGFRPAPRNPARPHHGPAALPGGLLLPRRAQVQVVLHHLTQHLPFPAGDELFKLVGGQPSRLGGLQLSGPAR
jgi:hypothetical protein